MFERIWEWIQEINVPTMSFPSMGWMEMVDILIVAFIVYFVMKWIRHTRAWSLIKGIIFILAIAAAAYLFNLSTVLWVLQNAFAMGLIVVVVLFQPELRKALEQIGRNRIFSTIYKHEGKTGVSIHTVNEVIKAVIEMAAVKTGALIVIEREMVLDDHEHTGIMMDAMVSSQLLMNIFERNTPLHDGATIIRNNRVIAASCILPLTAEEIGHDLGTRHRAAVGISEVSDALVVVVSEETGGISIVEAGNLTRNQNEQQLRKRLLTSEEHDGHFHLINTVKSHIHINPRGGKKEQMHHDPEV
jgi:diadenylate cyclase